MQKSKISWHIVGLTEKFFLKLACYLQRQKDKPSCELAKLFFFQFIHKYVLISFKNNTKCQSVQLIFKMTCSKIHTNKMNFLTLVFSKNFYGIRNQINENLITCFFLNDLKLVIFLTIYYI